VAGSIWKRNVAQHRDAVEQPSAAEAAAPAPVAEPPMVERTPLPPAAGDYGWLTADFDPNQKPDLPGIEAPPVSAPPVSASVPAPPVAIPAVEPPRVALPAVAPPEAPAPPAAPQAAAQSVPFWKKEISLGRKPKAPKQPRAKAEEAVTPPPTPFWKKELSFGRKAKAPAPTEQAVTPPSTPFWKKELSFGRKAKSPAPTEQAVTLPSTPFWKKELSFGRKAKAPAPAAPAPTPEQPVAKAAQPPFWKREVSFSKKPKAVKGARVPKPARAQATKAPAKGAKGTQIGLKIGASQIAAVRIANGDRPQLLQVARAPLGDGVVVAGEVRDIETLSQTLKELFTRNKLPKRNVRLGIANNRIGVRTFEITGIDDDRQLANAIRFRAHETLPIPLEEAVLDWRVLDASADPETGQPTRRVLLVVAYRDLVDRYVLACKKAGIRLSGIDLEAFAMLRALNPPRPDDGTTSAAAQVAVNVGHDRSTFAVSDGRACEFTRVLGWGGQNLSVAIARALDMTPSEAEPIKHALSLVASYAPPDGVTVDAMNVARDAVIRELQSFARELVSSLRFYQSQPGSLGIGELVLTGGSAHLPGFAEELHRLIGVPVRVGDPLNRLVIPKRFREPDDYGVGSLTVAIGLGIDD
jgi:type IV pilus assembly protein PilM